VGPTGLDVLYRRRVGPPASVIVSLAPRPTRRGGPPRGRCAWTKHSNVNFTGNSFGAQPTTPGNQEFLWNSDAKLRVFGSNLSAQFSRFSGIVTHWQLSRSTRGLG
jgi:hypothetical protein